jgi:hypothetical protein
MWGRYGDDDETISVETSSAASARSPLKPAGRSKDRGFWC